MSLSHRHALVIVTLGCVTACAPDAEMPATQDSTFVMAAPSTPAQTASRGQPVPVELDPFDGYPEADMVGAVTPWYWEDDPVTSGGEVPGGVTPLERDAFTSNDFYLDEDLWLDPRYWRCNSPISLDSMHGDYTSGPSAIDNGDPATAGWGHCERDYPREAIVSPYP